MLNKFYAAKQPEITALLELERRGEFSPPEPLKRLGFVESLRAARGPAIIAEYKRASPSRGDINLAASPEATAALYATGGAKALSVLTEEKYFKGHISFLERMACAGLPLLRKDFIFHPIQVAATAATPASAVLLIVRMLDDERFFSLLEACNAYGLEAVVEVFDRVDLSRAKRAGVSIIQVNNRDLATLRVDFAVSHLLAAHKGANEFWISASGVTSRNDVDALLSLGFDAALVGTSLMDGGDGELALQALTLEARHDE